MRTSVRSNANLENCQFVTDTLDIIASMRQHLLENVDLADQHLPRIAFECSQASGAIQSCVTPRMRRHVYETVAMKRNMSAEAFAQIEPEALSECVMLDWLLHEEAVLGIAFFTGARNRNMFEANWGALAQSWHSKLVRCKQFWWPQPHTFVTDLRPENGQTMVATTDGGELF